MGHGTEPAHVSDAGSSHAAGSGEIPAPPVVRHITPAPEDFATSPPARHLLWPVFWAVVVVLAVLAVRAHGWHEVGHAEPAPGNPAHGAPAPH